MPRASLPSAGRGEPHRKMPPRGCGWLCVCVCGEAELVDWEVFIRLCRARFVLNANDNEALNRVAFEEATTRDLAGAFYVRSSSVLSETPAGGRFGHSLQRKAPFGCFLYHELSGVSVVVSLTESSFCADSDVCVSKLQQTLKTDDAPHPAGSSTRRFCYV